MAAGASAAQQNAERETAAQCHQLQPWDQRVRASWAVAAGGLVARGDMESEGWVIACAQRVVVSPPSSEKRQGLSLSVP